MKIGLCLLFLLVLVMALVGCGIKTAQGRNGHQAHR